VTVRRRIPGEIFSSVKGGRDLGMVGLGALCQFGLDLPGSSRDGGAIEEDPADRHVYSSISRTFLACDLPVLGSEPTSYSTGSPSWGMTPCGSELM
jgi:hypothetical protein